jgi:hypothetical protein
MIFVRAKMALHLPTVLNGSRFGAPSVAFESDGNEAEIADERAAVR